MKNNDSETGVWGSDVMATNQTSIPATPTPEAVGPQPTASLKAMEVFSPEGR